MRSKARKSPSVEFAQTGFVVGSMHISHDAGRTFHAVAETCSHCLERTKGAIAGVITGVNKDTGVVTIDWHHEDGK